VDVRIQEGEKFRIQAFEGLVIARQGKGIGETFIVRKMSSQIGVERTFPVHSPIIESITVLRRGKVRRARLFYMRGKQGKAARVKEKKK
jgi:large subunit ribosomal protein L19